jgi:hypothetical protein
MFTLHRILLRIAAAWLAIGSVVIVTVCVAMHLPAIDWGQGLASMVFGPAFLVGVVA